MIRRLRVGEERERCKLGRGSISVGSSDGVATVGRLGIRGQRPQTKVISRCRQQISRLLLARRGFPEESRHWIGVCSFCDFREVETLIRAAW